MQRTHLRLAWVAAILAAFPIYGQRCSTVVVNPITGQLDCIYVPTGAGLGDVTGGSVSAAGELAAYTDTSGKVIGRSFAAFSGPASTVKTYTLPNASATILTTNSEVTVPQGGTGATSFTANAPLIGARSGRQSGGDRRVHAAREEHRRWKRLLHHQAERGYQLDTDCHQRHLDLYGQHLRRACGW